MLVFDLETHGFSRMKLREMLIMATFSNAIEGKRDLRRSLISKIVGCFSNGQVSRQVRWYAHFLGHV